MSESKDRATNKNHKRNWGDGCHRPSNGFAAILFSNLLFTQSFIYSFNKSFLELFTQTFILSLPFCILFISYFA